MAFVQLVQKQTARGPWMFLMRVPFNSCNVQYSWFSRCRTR